MSQPPPKQKEEARELLPCPFCGRDAIVFSGFLLARQRVVECVKCRSRATLYGSGAAGENEARAIAAWNRRALPARDTEIREVLGNLRTTTNCWCLQPRVTEEVHDAACLAAQALWNKVKE